MSTEKEEEYAQWLKDVSATVDPAKEEVTPEKAPEPAKEATETPPVEAAKPTETEPFPGYSALSDDIKASLKQKFEAAEKAEALKQERDQIEARWKAQHGQLVPTQRALQDAQRKLQELQSQPKVTVPTVSEDELKAYQANFPEESKVILGKYQELESKLKEVENWREKEAQRIQQVEQHLFITGELNQLNQHRPTWREDKPLLDKWIELLDPDEQQDAKALMGSLHAKDNIRLWKWFEREEKFAQLYHQFEQQEKPVEPGARKPPVDPNPRNRQSPAPSGMNAPNQKEQDYAKWLAEYDAGKAAARR